MLAIAWYLLKVVICSGILLGYYWLFLRNKIFHRYNRFYLLASIVLALAVPLIQINIWNKTAQPKSEVIRLLQVVTNGDDYMNELQTTRSAHPYLNSTTLLTAIYLIVSLIFFIVFIHVIWTIRSLVKKYQHRIVDNIWFVNTDARGTPFSFLRYIFWNDKIDIESQAGNQIFRHEVAHVQEKHSHDKIFMNIIMIIFWCNPFFWLIRKELNMIHEFIADKKAVEDSDTAAFAAMILATAYPQHRFQLTNNFFYSPIKRRILMLTKNKNPKVNYVGRVLVLPLTVLVFAAFTFKAKVHTPGYSGKTITVVIDAGHGGADAGAFSSDGIISEKDINLAIVKKIKEFNTNDKINIVLTRNDDTYQTPQEKAAFSNLQHPDLFISIHVDGAPKAAVVTKTGMSIWVVKDQFANAAQSKVLAATIISTFSKNYGLDVSQSFNQRQQGIWVLQASACPAVLIESGCINNAKDLAYLQSSAAKETIARNILSAIEKFAAAREQSVEIPATIVDTVPQYKMQPTGARQPIYFVDGKQMSSDQAKAISPNNILSINVVKGKNAIDKYGDKGQGGVVEIKTKKNDITGMNDTKTFDAAAVVVNNKPQLETGKYTSDDSRININKGENLGPNPLMIMDNKEYNAKSIPELVKLTGQNEFKSVNFYSGAQAVKMYGERAKDGAVVVVTKTAGDVKVPIHTEVKTVTGVPINVNANSTVDANINVNTSEDKVFTQVEKQPKFPGTSDDWHQYLIKNLDAGMPVKEGWKAGVYKLMLQFIVHTDGSISDITTTNYKGSKTAQHCIDLIKKGPKWEPAMQNGKPVDTYTKQPITFVIEEQN